MRTRRRIALAVLLGFSLFSGRSLLLAALREPTSSQALARGARQQLQSPLAFRRLAEELASEIPDASPQLADELASARDDCDATAHALMRHAPLKEDALRAKLAGAHDRLARAQLERAIRDWRARALPPAGRALEASTEELERAAGWRGGGPGTAAAARREVEPLARRLERGDREVVERDFETGVARIESALARSTSAPR